MGNSIVRDKSKQFALHVVKLYQYLCNEKKEFVLSKQLLRSGTSIGANVAEGAHAMSKKEFVAKMNISLKEAAESEYWLKLLHESDYLSTKEFQSVYDDCIKLEKFLVSIIKTANFNLKNSTL